MVSPTRLTNISEIRRYFHCNERPIYFVSATDFNLHGVDEWVRGLKFITLVDSYDGRHSNLFSPGERPHPPFTSIEDINVHLLQHPEVTDLVAARGGAPAFVFLMFDPRCEELVAGLGGELWLPPAALRARVDDKVETVRLGDRAGVPSVPNTLAAITDYAHLCQLADDAGLGRDLVVQLPFGDSGRTTFFVRDEADFQRHADQIVGQGEVKIMRRIRCIGTAIEACTTRCGTLVGPLMTELIGFPELTPHRGGWCGNEIFPGAFTDDIRRKAHAYTLALGDQLRAEGYRGYFELDFLLDLDTGDLWLGELNPRVTGASPMTNHAAFAYADLPLFLFHLLEFSGVDFDIDTAALNSRWSDPEGIDSWSQMAIRHTGQGLRIVTAAPQSGVYRLLDDGSVVFVRHDHQRRAIESEREAFFQRILRVGDYCYQGADLGILITRGRVMDEHNQLTPRAKQWIAGLQQAFRAHDLADLAESAETPLHAALRSAGSALFQQSYDSEAAGHHADALAAIDRLPGPSRETYVAELRRGWLLHRLSRHADARAAYHAAIAREPDSLEARVGAMMPAMAEKDLDACATLAREVLRIDPLNYFANLRLAYIHYSKGESAAAVAGYRRLLDAYPGDMEVKAGLGWSLLALGRTAEAARHFREILEVAPLHALARDGLLALSSR